MEQTPEQLQATLDLLGVTREQLEDRIVESITERLIGDAGIDEWGDAYGKDSMLWRKLHERAIQAINEKVEALGREHIDKGIGPLVENIILQKTNSWGERTGDAKPMTLTEYLVERADAYMRQPVDHQGKPKKDSGYRDQVQYTRLTHMVEKYLADRISKAMVECLKEANKAIAGGIEDAVSANLKKILGGIKASVSVNVPKLR